jgi:hypothetical protein
MSCNICEKSLNKLVQSEKKNLRKAVNIITARTYYTMYCLDMMVNIRKEE